MNSEKTARKIEKHYECRGVPLKLEKCEIVGNGERFIYTIKFKKRTKEDLIFDCARNIQLALRLPLFQPFVEDLTIKLAVSYRPLTENSLRKMLANPAFHRSRMSIPIPLGYDMRGGMRFTDLVNFPHALYGGATNSGKTVGLQNLIISIAVKQSVNRVNLILIDVGTSGLNLFHSLPHLSCEIVNNEEIAVNVIKALIVEMNQRTNIPRNELRELPALICVIDEYLSLIRSVKGDGKNDLISNISNLLQRGRHAKIHIILATQ